MAVSSAAATSTTLVAALTGPGGYRVRVSIAHRDRLARWMLLVILALGIIAMHHVPTQEQVHPDTSVVVVAASPSVSAEPMPGDHEMRAMLHECLAVLAQFAGGALVVFLAFAGIAWLLNPHRPAAPRAVARAPIDRKVRGDGPCSLRCVCCACDVTRGVLVRAVSR